MYLIALLSRLRVTLTLEFFLGCILVLSFFNQAFVGLNNGECIAYDMERLCSSPYTIPNLWAQHEDSRGVFRPRHVNMQ